MWTLPIAAIPGPWPALPVLAPWLAGGAAAAVGVVLAVVLRAVARTAPRRRPAAVRVRRLQGASAA